MQKGLERPPIPACADLPAPGIAVLTCCIHDRYRLLRPMVSSFIPIINQGQNEMEVRAWVVQAHHQRDEFCALCIRNLKWHMHFLLQSTITNQSEANVPFQNAQERFRVCFMSMTVMNP